jgi:hypothetical protein
MLAKAVFEFFDLVELQVLRLLFLCGFLTDGSNIEFVVNCFLGITCIEMLELD